LLRGAAQILVRAPLGEVRERWGRVEEYPEFMEGVKQVELADDPRVAHWIAELAGEERRWDARAIDWREDTICWEGADGTGDPIAYRVMMSEVGDGCTDVVFEAWVDAVEETGSAEDEDGLTAMLMGDLERFRDLVEGARGTPDPGRTDEQGAREAPSQGPEAEANTDAQPRMTPGAVEEHPGDSVKHREDRPLIEWPDRRGGPGD
jgi:hypothetical protein